jgi:hypothetical protein
MVFGNGYSYIVDGNVLNTYDNHVTGKKMVRAQSSPEKKKNLKIKKI